ncbi:MAG: hypothetical protein FWF73_03740 [Spirochaetes bacterium]|nr:hypothetical protein [Spirochaetota bacterium]
MQITDIIKTNSDRLFIVDTECFIIFTGESLNDEKPFIRIGTWYDLPVEIIPLVENIIVSDKIIGNPSYEQFNIDVRNLESNRYIGGESVLKRFLDYQKIFGLDLTNASLVKIEKDIPALPHQKNISYRNQFIGIFYSDGNIKINHGKENIFDLNSISSDNLSCADILNKISINSKNTDRYKGSGFIILDDNPIFYQKGTFTSYQFPRNCFNDFSTLQINPSYIRELLLPSDNLINTSNFMKFKNNRNGKIKLYSDKAEQIELIKKIFKNTTINDERFTNLHLNTSEGLKVNSYFDSPNIKASFGQSANSANEISVSFIKSSIDVEKILKDKSDMVLITYTAYEESVLLFKSTVKPFLLIDDGNPNLRKINEAEKIILKNGVQYELKKFNTFNELLKEFTELDEIKYALENFDEENIRDLINARLENNSSLAVYNILNLLKTFIDHTTDRKKYTALKNIYQNFYKKIPFNPDKELRSAIKIIIALYDNVCSVIIKPVQNNYNEKFSDIFDEDVINDKTISHEQKVTIKRIIEDRERLNRLLKIFYKEIENYPSFDKMKTEISLLKNEISTLREIYSNDFFLDENSDINEDKERTANSSIFKNLKFNLFNRKNRDHESAGFLSDNRTDRDEFNEYGENKDNELNKSSKLTGNTKYNDDKLNDGSKLLKYNELSHDSKSVKSNKLLTDDELNKKNKRTIVKIINNKKIIIAAVLILILLFAIYPFLKNRYFNTDSDTQSNIAGSDSKSGTQGSIAGLDSKSDTQNNISGSDSKSNSQSNITSSDSKSNSQSNITSSDSKSNSQSNISGSDSKSNSQSNIADSNLNNMESTNKTFTVKRVNDAEKEILQKHKVEISESDIYHYSNKVAVKNGYSEISHDYSLKNKNPHWIYPSNIFIMLDGEKVTVQKGDTLWDLARAKLEKMNADFYKIIDEIDKSKNKDKIKTLIIEAEKYSFMKQQIKILESYKKRFNNE